MPAAVAVAMVMAVKARAPAVTAAMAGRRIVAVTIVIAVVVIITIAHVATAVRATRFVHREPRSGKRMIGVIDALDGRDRIEPGPFEGRGERRLVLGPGVEHRCREHVSGDSTDGIELHVHGRHSKPGESAGHSAPRMDGNFRQARKRPMNRNDQMLRRSGWPRNPGHAIEFGT